MIVYVLDTNAVVYFVKGLVARLGWNAFICLIHPRARVVVPSYALEEVLQDFMQEFTRLRSQNAIRVPPTPLLRLLHSCKNVRILPRSGAPLAYEIRLQRNQRGTTKLPKQDVPIAAAVLAVRDMNIGQPVLITTDRVLKEWASNHGIAVLTNATPFRYLPS